MLHWHESDFLNAYKAHMEKVMAELEYLKKRKDEQEAIMNADNPEIEWFKEEKANLE